MIKLTYEEWEPEYIRTHCSVTEVEIKPKVQYELDLETLKKLQDLQNNPPSVATVPSATTKASTSIKSYDVHSVSDSFFQVAEKIKKGTAKVTCMNTEYDTIGHFSMGVKVTFEVYVYDF